MEAFSSVLCHRKGSTTVTQTCGLTDAATRLIQPMFPPTSSTCTLQPSWRWATARTARMDWMAFSMKFSSAGCNRPLLEMVFDNHESCSSSWRKMQKRCCFGTLDVARRPSGSSEAFSSSSHGSLNDGGKPADHAVLVRPRRRRAFVIGMAKQQNRWPTPESCRTERPLLRTPAAHGQPVNFETKKEGIPRVLGRGDRFE
eukprot:scaffold30431_cov31-Tisochrysis_lutea.AAC.4